MREKYRTALVKSFQANDGSLDVDGILGHATMSALDQYISDNEPIDKMQLAWDLAYADVGKGGDPGTNNASNYIRSLRSFCGFPEELTGSWCAIFASAIIKQAGIPVVSRGAYMLCEKIANRPQGFEIRQSQMQPGQVYLACWKRGRWNTHQEAHVGFVRQNANGLIERIGGNERGDLVMYSTMPTYSLESGLIMIVGWKS